MEVAGAKSIKFTVPSGFEITIREQTGDDDEIMSKSSSLTDGSAVNKLASAIIIDSSLELKRFSPDDIKLWKNNDKYYTLFKSRLLSHGTTMQYKHECSNKECRKENDYEEDLLQYDRDLSKAPEIIAEGETQFKYKIASYPNGAELRHDFTTSSNKKLRYTYLNGESELKQLALNKDAISKNTEFILRNLEWQVQDKWAKVTNFKAFSSTDMREIRNELRKNDYPFEAISEVTCPFCKTTDKISLMASPAFFFPGETL